MPVVMAVAGGIGWIYWHYAQEIPFPEPQQLIVMSGGKGICAPEDAQRQFVPLSDIPPLRRALPGHEGRLLSEEYGLALRLRSSVVARRSRIVQEHNFRNSFE